MTTVTMTERVKTEQLVKIAFRKGGIYVPNKGELKEMADPAVTQFNYEMLALGYILPEEAVLTLNEEFVSSYGVMLLNDINKFLGRDGEWKPFYKNFPNDILDLTEAEMMFNQMKHYLTGWEPEENPEDFVEDAFTKSCFEKFNCGTQLKCMGEEDIMASFKNALEMNQSLTPKDIEDLTWILKDLGRTDIIPTEVPFKETLAVVISVIWEKAIPYCSGINDILRGIMYHLEMPITFILPPKTTKNGWGRKIDNSAERDLHKFPNIPRSERKRILGLIEEYLKASGKKLSKDDLAKRREYWIKLGEKLHPGDYCFEFGLTYEMFRLVREGKLLTYGKRLSDAYKEGQDEVLKVLSERSGEFIRRFDSLYRRENFDKGKTLSSFAFLKNTPSTKVILEFIEHMSKRTQEYPRMVLNPDKRSYYNLPTLPALNDKDVEMIWEYAKLLVYENYTKQSSLKGKIAVLGDNIDDVRLPKNLRSMTESLSVITRGTAIDLPEDLDYLRAYAFWRDPDGSMDLDLWAGFLSEDFKIVKNVGWNETLITDFARHSGDVRLRPGDCAEFVDVDIKKAVQMGYKYLCIDVNDYQGRGFSTFENKCGVVSMSEKEYRKGSGSNWVPSNNIIQAYQPTTPSSSVLALIIDLETKKVYNMDVDLKKIPVGCYNNGLKVDLIKSLLLPPTVGVRELITMNVMARGCDGCISEKEFLEIENPVMEDYIFYRKEDMIKDYTVLKDLVN